MSQINKIGVIGAGNMGSGIVQKLSQEGIPVVMIDINEAFVEKGMDRIKDLLQQGVDRKIFKPQQVDEILSRITPTTDFNAVANADLVIEAVFEDKGVKSELFKKLDGICSEKTILATNTSSFFVKEFAEETTRPDRFIGLHYFYHPAKNRLLEVIPHKGTSPETLEKSLLAAKLHSKTAIVVQDAPGFAVNRFFVPFLNEAARLLEQGLGNIATIEAASKQAFKTRMGAFELMNVTGIPIAVHASTTLGNELGPFYMTCDRLKAQKEAGVDWDLSGDVDESALPGLIDRFHGVALGVAAALVDEGVASIEDVDRGAKIGLRWIRGPFEIMNKIGIDKTHEVVSAVCESYPDFKMPQILEKQKQSGKPFDFNVVDLAIKENIATITINRPEAMNALNETVVAQLDARFTEAENNPQVDCIVFEGAGKAFVAGADIKYFIQKIAADRISDIAAFTRKGHELLLRIENSSKLTVALLDGLSLGGGSELALACQAILATPAGSMAFPETGIGIFPGLGGMLRFSRHTGETLAKYYTFTGFPLSAKDAQTLGIVADVVPSGEVSSRIKAMAAAGRPDKYRNREIPEPFTSLAASCSKENVQRLLSKQPLADVDEELAARTAKAVGYKAPLAIRIANEIIDAQQGKSIPEAIEIELDRLTEIFSSADALEGLSSLGRKRPEYKGK